ncbi:MAG: Cof-type HAD-IIB family hydrolase [Muribaculaceae bacterium]|nr:Cof-type HAD-IIB family hydrolase [Muribaculaceae bacterium]
MNTRTLYVSDMDGTLLGADSRVSERSRLIISDLTEQGALITVATARTPATVQPLLAGVAMAPPAIVMTGAALWTRRAGHGSYSRVCYMDPADVDAVVRVCAACDVHPFVYTMGTDGGVLDVYHDAAEMNRAEQSFYDQRRHLRLKHFHTRRALPAEARCRTILFCALGRLTDTDAAARELAACTGCSVQSYPDVVLPDTGVLEVFAPGVSKAAAIEQVKARMGAERVVVFGDNLNDLPMFAVADVAVAVANALPQVREAAHVVIGPNTADSVARFIESDFLDG